MAHTNRTDLVLNTTLAKLLRSDAPSALFAQAAVAAQIANDYGVDSREFEDFTFAFGNNEHEVDTLTTEEILFNDGSLLIIRADGSTAVRA